jgi:predicted transposase YdaD
MQERLAMFDPLWEENPTIQKMRAESHMKGRQEGRQEERYRELQGLRHLLVSIVQPKYPVLLE